MVSIFKQNAEEAYLIDVVDRKITKRGSLQYLVIKYKKNYYRLEFTKRNNVGYYTIIPDYRVP